MILYTGNSLNQFYFLRPQANHVSSEALTRIAHILQVLGPLKVQRHIVPIQDNAEQTLIVPVLTKVGGIGGMTGRIRDVVGVAAHFEPVLHHLAHMVRLAHGQKPGPAVTDAFHENLLLHVKPDHHVHFAPLVHGVDVPVGTVGPRQEILALQIFLVHLLKRAFEIVFGIQIHENVAVVHLGQRAIDDIGFPHPVAAAAGLIQDVAVLFPERGVHVLGIKDDDVEFGAVPPHRFQEAGQIGLVRMVVIYQEIVLGHGD